MDDHVDLGKEMKMFGFVFERGVGVGRSERGREMQKKKIKIKCIYIF